VGLNPLGPCVFFLILARRRLYGGMRMSFVRREERIRNAEHGMGRTRNEVVGLNPLGPCVFF
jgi:hypothetical protein